MKAAVLEKPYTLSIKEVDTPTPGPGEVLVRVHSAGVCGSDLHSYRGAPTPYVPPVVLGHEFSGSVAAVGEKVKSVSPGARVTVLPLQSCGRCFYCRQGIPNLCNHRLLLGTQAWPGSFAEYMVAPEDVVLPLPEGLTDDVGALLEPLTVGVHGVRRAGLRLGDSVLVIGSGTIGLCIAAAARAAGASVVMATDVSDFNLSRAREVGATHTVNPRSGDVVAVARELTGGLGMDRVLVAVDAAGVLEQAIGAARKRATIAVVAMFSEPVTIRLQPARAAEQTLVGCAVYDETDLQAAIAMAAADQETLAGLVTQHFSLDQIARAFDVGDKRTENVVKIMVHA